MLHQEVARVYKGMSKDMGFNEEDLYHGNEAKRIAQNATPEAHGAIPEHARLLDRDNDGQADILQGGTHFEAEREPTPDQKGMWRQNKNPGLKWWQGGDLTMMTPTQRANHGLDKATSAHPAYFLLRRNNPGLAYVEKPVFKTRSDLLAQRKEAMKPDTSYDLDGDGIVGVREYYFAARMDKDKDGTLNVKEKLHGLKDMRENMENVMFVDNAGHGRHRQEGNQYRVIQQDGKIVLQP